MRTLLRRLLHLLLPARLGNSQDSPTLHTLREQILTGLLRIGALTGTLTLLIGFLPPLRDAPLVIYGIDAVILSLIWLLAINRRLNYWLRSGLVVTGLYVASLTELLAYGLSQDAVILFAFFAIFVLLFFDLIGGVIGLLLSALTLGGTAWQISQGQFVPPQAASVPLSLSTAITTLLIFLMVVGTVQVGIAVLLRSLRAAWQAEYQLRLALEAERDQLELRIASRTQELAQARDQAIAAKQAEAEQREFLATLHQMTLDLLNQRDLGDLLQTIVERATVVLNAPYGELMLYEDDALVVYAFTQNQDFLRGDRATRREAQLSWQAFDTRQPVLIDDYATWSGRREIYSDITLHAVADVPIIAGTRCLGVLAMGRAVPNQPFTQEEIQKGLLFSQLAALVVESAHLYTTAIHEIAERSRAERRLQEYADELHAQNAELDAFARTVAHDLKLPLSNLLGYSQLLQLSHRQQSAAEVDASLALIVAAGWKMTAIIDALLLLAQVRAIDSVPCQQLAMAEIVAEVLARLRRQIEHSGATISTPEHWPSSVGYAPWVEEVWINYLSNALKYSGQPPQLVLGASPADEGFVRFWVKDNGQPLTPAQQARLFTPFARLHNDRAGGHGLGLSIVQRIIIRLGGDVGMCRLTDAGNCFFFTLPANAPTTRGGEPPIPQLKNSR